MWNDIALRGCATSLSCHHRRFESEKSKLSIADQWNEIKTALKSSPLVVGSLRPPATEHDLDRWAQVIGRPLPRSLRELYAVHDGSAVIGGSGFSFVGERYPLPADKAIERFLTYDPLTRLWGLPTVIPFTRDASGCNLAVRADGADGVLHCFDDAPPMAGFASIEGLMTETVEALLGRHEEYRPEVSENCLSWINRDEEEDDLGYRL
jgi:hypothetical protein